MYVGQQPSSTFDSGIQDRFTGLTTNTVTLTHDISAETDILVVWNNIVQDSSTYSVGGTGNKTLTLGGTLSSGDVVTVYYTNRVMQSVSPTAGSVQTLSINDGAVIDAKIADVAATKLTGTIATARLGSGTASSSTFLRGDNSWASAGGDNTPYFFGKKASSQTITRNTMTNITGFTTNEIDSDSAFNGETFTVPSGEGGVYFFVALLESSFGSIGNDGERILATFEKGGSDSGMPREDFAKASGYNIQRYTNTISAVLSMSAGDTMNVAVYNKDGDASGNADVTNNSFFGGYKLITWVM